MGWLKKIQKESPWEEGGDDIIGKEEDQVIIQGYKNWVVQFDCKELITQEETKGCHSAGKTVRE